MAAYESACRYSKVWILEELSPLSPTNSHDRNPLIPATKTLTKLVYIGMSFYSSVDGKFVERRDSHLYISFAELTLFKC